MKISRRFVPKGPINNIPALVRIMACRRPGDKPLSEMMVSLLTHIWWLVYWRIYFEISCWSSYVESWSRGVKCTWVYHELWYKYAWYPTKTESVITVRSSKKLTDCRLPHLEQSLFYGNTNVTMIVPASGHQVRCIPWVQIGTFNKEIGLLCGLKFFALNIFCGGYLQSSLHLMLQIWWKPLLWKMCH